MNMNLFSIDFDEKLLRDFCFDSATSNIHFTKEEFTELIGQADEAIAKESENPQVIAEAYVRKFQLLLYQRKLAPKLLEKALALCPDMPQALIRMSVFYYLKDRRNIEKPLEYINKVIEIAPSYAASWLFRAYLSHDNREQVISDYAEYNRLKPDSPLGYELFGRYFAPVNTHELDMEPSDAVQKDLDTAIFNYTEAIRLNPSNRYNYLYRGELYLLKDQFYGAEPDHRNALSDIIAFYSILSECSLDHNHFNNLFYEFKPSLKERYCAEIINTVSPEKAIYWIAYTTLAKCYCEQKYYNKSLAAYSFIIGQNAKGSVFQLLGYSGRASAYSEMGDYDKALDDYSAIVEHGSWATDEFIRSANCNSTFKIPYDILPFHVTSTRAEIYRWDKSFQEKDCSKKFEMMQKAISEYSKAIEWASLFKNGYYLANIYKKRADLYNEIFDFDNAVKDYSAIIELDKDSQYYILIHAYKQRITYYLRQGDKEKAYNDYVSMAKASEEEEKYKMSEFKAYSNVYEVLNDVE